MAAEQGAWSLDELEERRAATRRPYLEFVRVPALSAGLYTLSAGALDGQSPHTEDEVYVVLSGKSRFTAGDVTRDVAAGDILFVGASVAHRFHDISQELRLAVIFGPAEDSAAP